jgi:GWxTD domain-containing protein
MKHILMTLLIMFSFLLAGSFQVFAEDDITVSADYAAFKNMNNDKQIDLELYVTFPLKQLEFSQNPEDKAIYDAAYFLKIHLTDPTQDSTFVNKDENEPRFAVVNSPDEIKETSMAVELVRVTVPAGTYLVQIAVIDANNKKMGIWEKEEIQLTTFDKKPSFSSLMLATGGEKTEQTENKYYKNGYFIVPNPNKAYIADKQSLVSYFEIYGLEKELQGTVIPIAMYIREDTGKINDSRTVEYTQDGENGFFVGKMNLDKLIPGRYSYNIVVGSNDKPLNTYKQDIVVTNSSMKSNVSSANIPDELASQIRDEIRLIATDKEMKLWDSLVSTQRADFLKAFWMRRDPDQKNPQVDNEYRRLFYERLKIVDERFSYLHYLGRNTDRGRVYLTFGEPDTIASDPMGISSITSIDSSSWSTKGAVAWEYTNRGSDKSKIWFTFVDQNGDGVFRIYSSNVQGWGKYQPDSSTSSSDSE